MIPDLWVQYLDFLSAEHATGAGSPVGVHVNAHEGRGVGRFWAWLACGQVPRGQLACQWESACRCIIAMPPFRRCCLVAFWHCFIAWHEAWYDEN